MKLKLRTQNIEPLRATLSLISPLRKFIILRFTSEELTVVLNNGSVTVEPQVWCKLRMASLFDHIEIQSIRENTIMLEINLDLLVQTFKNFEKANSDSGLSIRLQRKDTTGAPGTNLNTGRSASLALAYSHVNSNSNEINHNFRIPVRILKGSHDLREPELGPIDVMMRLPNEFSSVYKRLDKLKASSDLITIRAKSGGLAFELEDDGKYKITITWNQPIDIQKPLSSDEAISDSIRSLQGAASAEEKDITVKLHDWRMALKIVATCKTVVFLVAQEACVLHCLLNESEDVSIVFYTHGVTIRDYD